MSSERTKYGHHLGARAAANGAYLGLLGKIFINGAPGQQAVTVVVGLPALAYAIRKDIEFIKKERQRLGIEN